MLEVNSMVIGMNKDVERLENNIRKLEDRISVLQNDGQSQDVIDVLGKEKFNQQRLIYMAENLNEASRPLCMDVLVSEIYRKHRYVRAEM